MTGLVGMIITITIVETQIAKHGKSITGSLSLANTLIANLVDSWYSIS